ncbi:MAG: nematocyst expressed protein 6-like [Ramlibacter sp.]|jgi:hypothetical protein|nr:nematocyst expressed protein 6-like [Ramlibacter sp.]
MTTGKSFVLALTSTFTSVALSGSFDAGREVDAQRLRAQGAPVVRDSKGTEYLQIDDVLIPLTRAGTKAIFPGRAWPNGVVYYEFSSSVTSDQKKIFEGAAAMWSAVSALTFVEDNKQKGRILVETDSGAGCGSSVVGYGGNVQALKIAPHCWSGRTPAHEIGHAIGLAHEHQHTKQETVIEIDGGELEKTCPDLYRVNYHPLTSSNSETAYDFASIMHYSSSSSLKCKGTSMTVKIKAIAAQPAGAPAGSANACTAASDCTKLMGATKMSGRDAYGAAQRYGYRINYDPAVALVFSGTPVSCGKGCASFAVGAKVVVTAQDSNGKKARLAGDCVGVGTCELAMDGNKKVSVAY